MLLICFVSCISALITKTGSNTIGENNCELSQRCMNDSISVPVTRASTIKCIKRTSCPILNNNLSCTFNPINKIHIHLRDIRIKQKKNGYWVQVILSSYDDFIAQGNQSLLVKFSFEEDHACYQFSIPFFTFMTSKDILLPYFRIKMLQRHYLGFYFSLHYETDEVISIQAMKYSLNNVADGQWLGGSVLVPSYVLDDELVYFSFNATQDFKCSFNNSIAIYKPHPHDVCNIEQTPIYKSILSPDHKLNISRNLLTPCQKYCIYATFSKSQQCGTLHPKHFFDISFIQLPPVDVEEYHTKVPEYDCEMWNFTIDIKVIQKNIITTMLLWPEYSSCFSSYYMCLYKFTSPTCDPDLGQPGPVTFKFKARHDNKEIIQVFKNATVGYYCILVVPFLNESAEFYWTRDSGPFIVSEIAVGNNTGLGKKDENRKLETKVIVAISFLLFFTAFVLWSCSVLIKRAKAKTGKDSLEISNEKEEIEGTPLLAMGADSVYLFYPGDDDSITDKVFWLKDFLQEEAQLNVITLSDIMPEILEQPIRYVPAMLECGCSGRGPSCSSRKKFVVVFSEKVLRDFNNNDSIWKCIEEKAFREVLEYITTDWGKAYCHLFVVAFNESIFIDHRFRSIVPRTTDGVYYAVPDDLPKLCARLNSSSSGIPRPEQRDVSNAVST